MKLLFCYFIGNRGNEGGMDFESDYDDIDFVERDYYSISKLSFRVLRNLIRKSWLFIEDVRESVWDNIVICY